MSGGRTLPALAASIALAAGLALAGCAPIGAPAPDVGATGSATGATLSATATGAATGTVTATGPRTGEGNEVPTPAPPERALGAPTPAASVTGFAAAYTNWSSATVVGDLRALARASIGQARSAMELSAAETARDGTLRQGRIANHGVVEAVAPEAGRRGAYVVVTRESTTASDSNAYQGLAAQWHVTVATVAREPNGRWVVSGWQPES